MCDRFFSANVIINFIITKTRGMNTTKAAESQRLCRIGGEDEILSRQGLESAKAMTNSTRSHPVSP
jgi:hypothetical protein